MDKILESLKKAIEDFARDKKTGQIICEVNCYRGGIADYKIRKMDTQRFKIAKQ